MSAVPAMTSANWRYIWPVMPGMKADGKKTDMSTRVMPMMGPEQFAHGIDARLLGRLPSLNVLRYAFDHDDGVIHDDADGEHDGKEGEQIDAETHQRPWPANAPMIVTGTVVAGTSVARQFWRKIMMTSSTSMPASNSV